MATPSNPASNAAPDAPHTSLPTRAARQLAHTTKSVPQMQGVSPRWLLRMLPWVDVKGGVYRVNRRLTYTVGDGRVSFSTTGARAQVIPQTLGELPLLRGFDDAELLGALASRFVQREHRAGEPIVTRGQPAEHVVLIVHGKAQKRGVGKYGDDTVLEALGDGDHVGDRAVVESNDRWSFTVKAVTACTVLVLAQQVLDELIASHPGLSAHVARYRAQLARRQDKFGQAAIAMEAGHNGEPVLPASFVDLDAAPREYELGVAQTVLRVHTRVSDLFNQPHDQREQQLRLTVEALREHQEWEMLNNREFGLLHNADLKQRIPTRKGPPTPDDMDEILSRRRKTQLILAHPRAIAAFGQECSRRGFYPTDVDVMGTRARAWRGVPILPCDKIPISEAGTTSILMMRMGVENQGVVGLHHTGLPEEVEPGVSARRMTVDPQAITEYLVSTYFSAAVMVPDALGILEEVQLG